MEFLSFLEKDANEQLKESLAIMTKINSEMGKIGEKRKGISTPSGSDSANKQLIADYQKMEATIVKMQSAIDKLSASKQTNNKKTQEEITNGRILAQNSDRQVKATSQLAGAYRNLSAQVAIASEKYQNIIVRGKTAEQTQKQYNKELRTAQQEFQKLQSKVLQADNAVGKWNRTNERSVGFVKDLSYALGWTGLLLMLKDLAFYTFGVAKQLESQNLALRNVVGSAYEYLRAQRFLREIAKDYGGDIQNLNKLYSQFYVNAKGKLERPEIEKVFASISKSAGFMGLSVQQQERAFLALNQMMSKGTVQAEELRGQLAEALPGAVQAMSRAYQKLHPELKVTEESFLKLMKDGKIISAQVLPEMVVELEKMYGILDKKSVNTLTASLVRAKNAFVNFIDVVSQTKAGGVVGEFFGTVLNGWTEKFDRFSEAIKSDAQRRREYLQNIGQTAEEEMRITKASKGGLIEQEAFANAKLKELYAKRDKLRNDALTVEKSKTDKSNKSLREFIKLSEEQTGKKYSGQTQNEYIMKANELIWEQDGYIRALLKTTKDFNKEEEEAGNKTKKERIRLNYEEAKSLSDLLIAKLEQQRAMQKDLMDNEYATDFGRLEARKEYSRLSLEILEEQHKQENLMNELQRKEDLRKATETYNENKKNGFNDLQNTNEYNKALADINDKYNNLYKTSEVKLSTETRELWLEDANFYNKIQKDKFDKAESERKGHFEREQKLNDDILKLQTTRFNEIANNEKYLLITRAKAFESYKQLALVELDNEKRRSLTGKETAKELDLINEKYRLQKEAIENLVTPLQRAQEETRKYLDAFRQDQLKMLDDVGLSSAKIFLDFQKSIDEDGNVYWQSTFDKMIEGAKDLKEEFKVVFSAVSEVAQEAFNIINEAGQASTQAEIDRLKIQYDTAWEFSDKSDVAKRKLDAERERREKEIAQKEFKRKQNMAVVNIAIDTAQAIMATYGQAGFFGGLGGAYALGVIGLAQIALVKSQKMPEYYTGTDNAKEGFALTQERGREIIKDKHGRIKSLGSDKGAQITWLDSGDKVLNNQRTMQELMFDKDLNNILANNNIAMPKIEMHAPKIDFSPVVDAINNQPIIIPDFDKLKTRIKRGNTIQTIEKAHTNFSSVKI